MKQRYNMGYGIYKTKPQQCRKVAARMIHAWDWRMLGNPKHTMPCSMVSIHMLHERSWTYMKVHLFGVCIYIYIYMYDYMILYVCIICMYNIYIYIHICTPCLGRRNWNKDGLKLTNMRIKLLFYMLEWRNVATCGHKLFQQFSFEVRIHGSFHQQEQGTWVIEFL